MTATLPRTWWSAEPAAVRAVLDLADLANAAHIADTFAPQFARDIDNLGADLVKIERLRLAGSRSDILDAGFNLPALNFDQHAERCADELQADVLRRARDIAAEVAQ